ncbi:hypothetical protein pb186bvf_008919 [Paramecium bursaria]
MWYNSVLYSIQNDEITEQLLQEITNHLQQFVGQNFSKGYEILISELIDQGYQYIEQEDYDTTQLIIDFLQFWNNELYMIQNSWALRNLTIFLLIKLDKQQKAKQNLKALLDEMQFYSIGSSQSQLFEIALAQYYYCMIEKNCKQQATQAILRLQQLLISNNDQKFVNKIHLLMASIYQRLGDLEKSQYEQNQFYIQSMKVAGNHTDKSIMNKITEQTPKNKKKDKIQDQKLVQLEEISINISGVKGTLSVNYDQKTSILTLLFDIYKFDINLCDIANDINIYQYASLPNFINEFVNQVTNFLDIDQQDLFIETQDISLESYSRIVIIRQKKGGAFLYFGDEASLTDDLRPLIFDNQL